MKVLIAKVVWSVIHDNEFGQRKDPWRLQEGDIPWKNKQCGYTMFMNLSSIVRVLALCILLVLAAISKILPLSKLLLPIPKMLYYLEKRCIYFTLYVWAFYTHVCMCTAYLPHSLRGQKRVPAPLELELQVSCHVDAGKWIGVLCKNIKCSEPLSHPSRPSMCYLI